MCWHPRLNGVRETEGTRRVIAATCLALALAAATAGCHSISPPHGTAAGMLIRVGGPALSAAVPLPGRVTATRKDGTRITVAVAKDGQFRMSLPPGTYQFTGHSPLVHVDNVEMTCRAAHPVHITASKTTVGVKIICSIF